MYNRTLVQTAFLGLAGLRQNQNPDFEQLSPILTYTGENILIQHPLLNIENIDMTSRNYALYNYPAFAAGTTYSQGDRIRENSIVYESLTDNNTGNVPDSSPTEWQAISLLSLYLEDVFRDAINDVVHEVFQRKKLNRQTKRLLQNQRLSDTTGAFNNRVINTGSLVGVEFKLKYNENIKAVIDKIALQLSGAQADVEFYLYHSSQVEPLESFTINQTKTGSVEWHDSGLEIEYKDLTKHDTGGVFYLMYDQNSLGVQAIKKVHNWNRPPCGYCNRNEINFYNKYTKYLDLRTVQVEASKRNADDDTWLWDLNDTKYVSDNNFGLNFEWTVECDLTDYIIKEKRVFEFAVRDMTIRKLLENMANSTRQNGLDEKVRLMARSELQSKHIGGMGIMSKVEKQLDEVDFEISALDDTCMPCNNPSGLRIGAAGLARRK